jgi:hypothetical protein
MKPPRTAQSWVVTLPLTRLALLMLLPVLGACNRSGTKTAETSSGEQSSGQNNPNTTNSNPFAAKQPNKKSSAAESGRPKSPDSNNPQAAASPPSVSSVQFTRVDRDLMPEFTYQNGDTGRLLMVESIGGGVGWLDFDEDHRPDLYFVQGGNPAYSSTDKQPLDRLYQQHPDGRFIDVTEMAGIAEPRYGQGIAVADFNDDGFDDLYVTNVGRNTLYQNQGDGTFVDVTMAAGVGDERWSCSAAWGDLDGDGDLDLYVGNYCDYDPRKPLDCSKDGKVHICHPRDVPPVPDECYINQGDGTFTAEAKQRGLFGEGNRALGVVIADFDRDGDQDIYVANDTTANFLFINQGAGQFVESAITLGCAVDHNGSPQASMGVACGDFDRNGFLDLYCTHFQYESNTLYQNFGASGFEDVTGKMGLHSPTYAMLGFGTVMVDFDQNGQQELFVANGHIERTKFQNKIVYEMEPQLFSFDGQRFHEQSRQSGDYFKSQYLGRGVATADWDADGDIDLCVVHQNQTTALLRNDSQRGHWLQLRLVGNQSNRRAVGTEVILEAPSGTWVQQLVGGSSFAASHQPLIHFGLGPETTLTRLTIRWPSGKRQVLEAPAIQNFLDTITTLSEPATL